MKSGVDGSPFLDDSHVTFEQVHEAVMRSEKNRAALAGTAVESYGTGFHTTRVVARNRSLEVVELAEYLPPTRVNGEPYRYALVRRLAHAASGPPVKAECHTDDHKYEVDFDAAPYFTAATDEEIRALARADWCSSSESDAVAEFCAEGQERLEQLFDYLSHAPTMPLSDDHVGFECTVDEQDAIAWLKANRPALADELSREEEGD
jgi:hypothetical protein